MQVAGDLVLGPLWMVARLAGANLEWVPRSREMGSRDCSRNLSPVQVVTGGTAGPTCTARRDDEGYPADGVLDLALTLHMAVPMTVVDEGEMAVCAKMLL
ncbi:hypothetical protein GCM10018963_15380 [Saccharothrix longispora]